MQTKRKKRKKGSKNPSSADLGRAHPPHRADDIVVTVSPGDEVRLAVDIYGAQDILDNSLGDGIAFDWGDGDAGGRF